MMGFSSGNEKIDKYLDELSDEYKELLFKALLDRSPSIDNLNISELLRIDNEIKKPLLTEYRKDQRKRHILFLAGIAYMFIGLSVYILYETAFRNKVDAIALASVVVGFTGLCISLYAYLSPRILMMRVYADTLNNTKDVSLASYEVIKKWRELEGIANDLNIKDDKSSPHSIIQFFLSNQYITSEEAKALKDFLKLRNEIVHTSTANYTHDEIITAINAVDDIINKFHKII